MDTRSDNADRQGPHQGWPKFAVGLWTLGSDAGYPEMADALDVASPPSRFRQPF